MEIVLWILQGLLAAMFLMAGMMKLVKNKEKFVAGNMAWAADFKPNTLKLIGALEVLGAVGVVLPMLLDIYPILTAWAAAGLALTMVGAFSVHMKRKETPQMMMNLLLLAMALVVAVARFTA
jgi:uncharacterized membrane protein YphA (DoxX/SURF4 family)